jgi:hypothetical protein
MSAIHIFKDKNGNEGRKGEEVNELTIQKKNYLLRW